VKTIDAHRGGELALAEPPARTGVAETFAQRGFAGRGSRPGIAMLAVVALAMWALKRHYADADVGALRWILKPVADLAAALGGTTFDWEPGSGYLSREKLLVIAKPCAGVNFMLAAFAMTGFLLAERADSWRAAARLTLLGGAMAYVATLVANTTRIVVALWLSSHPLTTAFWTAPRVHRLEGVVVYFGMLGALHFVVRRIMSAERRDALAAWVPLASYYVVTIAVPLANGAGDMSRGFLEHLIVVALVPPTLVGAVTLLQYAATCARRGAIVREARRRDRPKDRSLRIER
jgi:exosortase K